VEKDVWEVFGEVQDGRRDFLDRRGTPYASIPWSTSTSRGPCPPTTTIVPRRRGSMHTSYLERTTTAYRGFTRCITMRTRYWKSYATKDGYQIREERQDNAGKERRKGDVRIEKARNDLVDRMNQILSERDYSQVDADSSLLPEEVRDWFGYFEHPYP